MNTFRYGVLLASITLLAACGNDSPNIPDETTGSKGESVEKPEETVEPLTDELRPMLLDGRKWIIGDSLGRELLTMTVEGDVTFEGGTGKLIKRTYVPNYGSIFYNLTNGSHIKTWGDYYSKEEDGRVYVWHEYYPQAKEEHGYTDEWLAGYDMNAQPGDTIVTRNWVGVVESRGTIPVMGKLRRALKINEIYRSWRDDYVIEGIGSINDRFVEFNDFGPHPTYAYAYIGFVQECWDGDEKIFDWKEFDASRYTPEKSN